ncbi:MAG: HlyC/CorC family transporter [Magnetococcales bacterium]|nr:HlyC/CorC family transporter [Magnetococcales bacterium]
MNPDIIMQLFAMILLMLLKGFFSGSEIAMVNSDKLKMRHLAKNGNRGAQKVLKLFETPDVILGTTLVGTNIATVGVSTMGALIFIEALGSIGDLISVLVLTPFMLILGEIVPKSVYQQKADTIVTWIIYPLHWSSIAFMPVIFIFSRVARFATKLVGGSSDDQEKITREGIRMILEMSEAKPGVEKLDKERIRRIIRFADTTVGESMVPLAEVAGIREDSKLSYAIQRVRETGFNRLPVYKDNITDTIGVLTLNSWDLLMPKEEMAKKKLNDFIHKPLYLSPIQNLDQVLGDLRSREDHFGVVVDEFGSSIGVLTMEDILEEVMGEIDLGINFEEYRSHSNRYHIEKQEDDSYHVDGRTPISHLNDELYLHLPVGKAHTIAGLIGLRLGRIPKQDDHIVEQDYRLTVIEADDRSATKILMERNY